MKAALLVMYGGVSCGRAVLRERYGGGGGETPTPVARLSDSDISRLATEVVVIMDRRSEHPVTSSSSGSGPPPGELIVPSCAPWIALRGSNSYS